MGLYGKMCGKSTNEEERNCWISKQLEKLPAGLKLLDVGAGELKWKKACSHLQYVSQDFCQYDGKGDSKGLQTGKWDTEKIDIVCDITDIPIQDEEFDVVLCSEVLEHLPQPELAIRELSRVLKKGGVMILTAPFCSLTHFAPYHFCTGFNYYWYEYHLKKNQLRMDEVGTFGNYFLYLHQELLRLPELSEKYTGRKSRLLKLETALLARRLKKYAAAENDFSELLCFGYHVLARKMDDECLCAALEMEIR